MRGSAIDSSPARCVPLGPGRRRPSGATVAPESIARRAPRRLTPAPPRAFPTGGAHPQLWPAHLGHVQGPRAGQREKRLEAVQEARLFPRRLLRPRVRRALEGATCPSRAGALRRRQLHQDRRQVRCARRFPPVAASSR